MKERPIIMNAESVRAILDGRKTQTRRVIKDVPKWVTTVEYHEDIKEYMPWLFCGENQTWGWSKCPYGIPGDLLWVRETWQEVGPGRIDTGIYYAAMYDGIDREILKPWRSPLYMPRWASRIDLEVVSVRAERLQDISEDDAIAEGFTYYGETLSEPTPREKYADLWDALNAKRGYPWDANPWVWVVEFRRVKP